MVKPGGGQNGKKMMGQAKDRRKTLKRVWSYLRAEKIGFFAVVASILLSTIFTVTAPAVLGIAIDEYIVNFDLEGLPNILALLAAVYIGAAFFMWLQSFIMAGVAQKVVRNLRNEVFAKLQELPLKYFDTHTKGELMSRVTNDIENISVALSEYTTQLISSVLTVTGVLIAMFALNVPLAIASVITVPLVIFLAGKIAQKSYKAFSEQQEGLGSMNGFVEEYVSGQKVVKLYGQEELALGKFDDINVKLRDASMKANIYGGVMGPLMTSVNNLNLAIVVGVGGVMTLNGMATVGLITSFINYSRQFARPINQVAQVYGNIQGAIAGAERVFNILDEKTEFEDESEEKTIGKLEGTVDFEGVDFAYDEERLILKDINIHAKPGETIALVGPTGSGKTTVINVLSRFYEVKEGAVKVDGKDIRDINKKDLREKLGVVLQDAFLFSGTVKDNIKYGKLEATDEEIKQAAKVANAHSFIKRLPQGYDTPVVEEGKNLSQGQRQLITIARAVLSDPDILVLDEATSSVDTRTEQVIQEGMNNLMEGRTSFVIAHRLKTIKNADKIVVLKDGEIIELGSHNELLDKGGFYSDLYTTQFGTQNM